MTIYERRVRHAQTRLLALTSQSTGLHRTSQMIANDKHSRSILLKCLFCFTSDSGVDVFIVARKPY